MSDVVASPAENRRDVQQVVVTWNLARKCKHGDGISGSMWCDEDVVELAVKDLEVKDPTGGVSHAACR